MIKTKESALEEEEKSIIMMISRTENLIVRGQRKYMKGEVNINAHTRKICLSKLLTASLHNNAYRKGQSVTKSLSFNQHFRLRKPLPQCTWRTTSHIPVGLECMHWTEHTAGSVTTSVASSSGMPPSGYVNSSH